MSGSGILRMHQARDRIFHLAAVEDHRGVHREQVVLAGVVDVQMRVHDVAHVAHAHAVLGELVLDHVLVELQAAHAERFHDLVGAVAGVDHHRPGAAQDQEAQRRHAARAAAVAAEHEEAAFQFDVAVVENLDFEGHGRPSLEFRYCCCASGAQPRTPLAGHPPDRPSLCLSKRRGFGESSPKRARAAARSRRE